jgi:hypothetical protein
MTDKAKSRQITIDVSEDTMEQIKFLAEGQGIPILEMAGKLLAEEAEAQAGLTRGPFLRNYMYR